MDNNLDTPNFFGPSTALSTQDFASAKTLLDQISASGDKVAKVLTTGFGSAAISGKSFNDTLLTIGQSLARLALREGVQTLSDGLSSLTESESRGFPRNRINYGLRFNYQRERLVWISNRSTLHCRDLLPMLKVSRA